MYIDRALLKKDAKLVIFDSRFKLLLVATVYLVLMTALNIFAQNLSGYTAFALAYAEQVAESGMVTDISGFEWPEVQPVAWIIVLCVLVMRMIMRAGYINYILLSVRRMEAGFKNLLDGFYFPVKVVLMETVKYTLIVFGVIFFILPGVLLFYMFRLSLYIMFDNPERGAIWCLAESARLMSGHKMEFMMLDLSFMGWYILVYLFAITGISVVDIWVSPYTELTYAGCYNKIVGWEKPADIQNTDNLPQ